MEYGGEEEGGGDGDGSGDDAWVSLMEREEVALHKDV